MRTPSKTAIPTEPFGTALGTARDAALTARDKGLELLESEAAQELLRKGQHVAIVARDRGAELLESDAAHEFVRRGKDVVSAARGELVTKPTKSRRPLGMVLFVAGAAAGVAAAVVSKRMAAPIPEAFDPPYDDPSTQFPTKGGTIDLTSVAAEEGLTATPAQDLGAMGDVEIGTATKMTRPAAVKATSAGKSASASKSTSAASPTANGSTAAPTP